MSRRTQVVTASILLIIGIAFFAGNFASPALNAAGVAESGFDYTKIFLWGGAILLVVSAFLYIRASSD